MSGYKNSEALPVYFYGHCSYPSCRHNRINSDEPFVAWNDVSFSPEQIQDNLSPMSKLAVVANPSEYVEKFGHYGLNMFLHPECAAEWGMHLIQNAIKADPEVGRKLREPRNALRK
jgi:hypothetical protein